MKLKVIAAINESYIYTRLDTGYGQITNSQIGNEYKISFWKAPGSKGGGGWTRFWSRRFNLRV